MNKDNINTVAHRFIKERISSEWICVDGTAGNGNDTHFLCQYSAKVIAFDIQEEAMKKTINRCEQFNNLNFYLMSHEYIRNVLNEPIDCAIFNFGYLPNSNNKECITLPESSLKAVKQCFDCLKNEGILVLACYLMHKGGQEEHDLIYSWIASLKNMTYTTYQQKENSPILYMITKKEHRT